MPNRYLTDDGDVHWERVTNILIDINDGYLSNLDAVDYGGQDSIEQMIKLLSNGEGDVEADVVGSRLLSTLSSLNSIGSKVKHGHVPAEDGVYRASKFVAVASKLSDAYAMEDSMYQQQWHGDVLNICEAIRECNRDVNTEMSTDAGLRVEDPRVDGETDA